MANARCAALKTLPLFTTDIMNEPIAKNGLHFRFDVMGDGRLFEALGSLEQISELELVATKISEAEYGQPSNVIDMFTRKRTHSGARALSWEVVADGAPGRYSTGLYIFEATGEVRLVKRLAAEAAHIIP